MVQLRRNEGKFWYKVPCCCFPMDGCCYFRVGAPARACSCAAQKPPPLQPVVHTFWHIASLKLKEIFSTRDGFQMCPHQSPDLKFFLPWYARWTKSPAHQQTLKGDRGCVAERRQTMTGSALLMHRHPLPTTHKEPPPPPPEQGVGWTPPAANGQSSEVSFTSPKYPPATNGKRQALVQQGEIQRHGLSWWLRARRCWRAVEGDGCRRL